MKRTRIQWVIGLMLTTIMFAGLSCAHRNAEKQDISVTPADHESMLSQYRKGIEESKKIVIVRVNGENITMDKLLSKMNQIAPDHIAHGLRTPEIDERVRQEALDILVFRELAVQEAVKRGMNVPQEQLDEALKKIRANSGSDEAFNKSLSMTGETEESLRKEIERNRLFDMIAKEEIFRKAKENADEQSVELRKREWEEELKKDAKIEILPATNMKDEAGKPGNE